MGARQTEKNRTVYLLLVKQKDKGLIWAKRFSLKSTSIIMKEYPPYEIERRASTLLPIYKLSGGKILKPH